ncbi:MAG TPA: DNA-protecting protein DprA [Chlorobaculum parvum]|uniref:DNA-protecting protein DprA n=1 Tax=Chlorobaculum parvum TaxID=274539 RepID=A0A7C5HTZ8_9CHLB|nr:DNA-protecting protein DprA [Chlorobaculum parvum]
MTTTPESNDTLDRILMLSKLPGIGPARARAMIAAFGSGSALLEANTDALIQIPGIGETLARQTAENLASPAWRNKAKLAAEEQIERAGRLDTTIITMLDPAYPELLKQIYDPPLALFVRGNVKALVPPSLAVVGTRRATSYGKQATEVLCRDLVGMGLAIVSGMAYGIDMTAHHAALEHGGVTIAVLGCGVDTIYTDPSGRLWPRIIERGGAIIAEDWLGTEPVPGNFPRRNRLIAGITLGTLVVESDVKGGSMITAASALEQNREVFAVPGSIFAKVSRGPNSLIQRSQAKAVLSAEDILTELPPAALLPTTGRQEAAPSLPPLTPEESRIIETLEKEAIHIDLIAEKTALPLEQLLVHLFELEMNRIILQEPGQLFSIRPPERR